MTTTIDVSAQYGGRDAFQAVFPHFRALKAALKGRAFDGFPFPELALILRVDGEVSSYGLSGAGNVDIDRNGIYVSIDIGISNNDRSRLDDSGLVTFIGRAIESSANVLCKETDPRLMSTDWDALRRALEVFSAAYRSEFRRD